MVRCKRCQRERLLDRDRLIRELTRKRLSTAWEALPHQLKCLCGSKDVTILAMPFTSGEEDGKALFEHLLRTLDVHRNIPHRTGSAEWCKAAADASQEFHYAKVAMRAWIVARGRSETKEG